MDFHIQGSTGDFYTLSVDYTSPDECSISCDCPAGQFGDLCKHVKSFFECDSTLFSDQTEATAFISAGTYLRLSRPFSLYAALAKDLAAIDQNQKALKAAAKNLKRRFLDAIR